MRRIEPLLDRFGEGGGACLPVHPGAEPHEPRRRHLGHAGAQVRHLERHRRTGVDDLGISLAGRFVGEKLHIDRYVLPVVAAVVVISIVSIAFEMRRIKRRATPGS